MALTRSEQMARIRSCNTRPERLLRSALWASGLRYRVGASTSAGRPDVVFPRIQVAVFIDGCFWHGCPQHYVAPRTRTDFWRKKLKENQTRDRQQTMALKAQGWTVIRIWEHEVLSSVNAAVDRIAKSVARRQHCFSGASARKALRRSN